MLSHQGHIAVRDQLLVATMIHAESPGSRNFKHSGPYCKNLCKVSGLSRFVMHGSRCEVDETVRDEEHARQTGGTAAPGNSAASSVRI